jgi:hypothetical protein
MQVHWESKWLSIPYQGSNILLQGIKAPQAGDLVFQLLAADLSNTPSEIPALPTEISKLLLQFPEVFKIPDSLPPKRSCDHTIPLITGASPVNIRAYRYPPSLKDEIDKQVQEMLDHGLIQPSTSPFSSPVLLVRKKDGTWRFCVDYRYLNALTVKFVYPIPIFEQLVDELGSASWFSIIDLYSGYHQIRLQ